MNKGASLYFTLVILNVLTAVVLLLVNISVSQIKITGISADSMLAFYAADSGAERVLRAIAKEGYTPSEANPCPPFIYEGNLENGAKYEVCVPNSTTTIQSKGTYRSVQRKIELKLD